MIEYIEGKIVQKNPAYVVIDIGGIGYHIKITLYSYEQLSDHESSKLLIHQVIKEDSNTLYGFVSEEERQLFRSLLSVTGIGPGTAILILSSIRTSELRKAIITSDITLLKSVKGVGQKTAQRIVIDLQDSMKKELPEMAVLSPQNRDSLKEAVSALVMLGFKKQDAEQVIMKTLKNSPPDITVEEIIRSSLKNF